MADEKRIIMLIGMMGAGIEGAEGEAINAFRLASRALKENGLSWREIAEKAFAPEAVQKISLQEFYEQKRKQEERERSERRASENQRKEKNPGEDKQGKYGHERARNFYERTGKTGLNRVGGYDIPTTIRGVLKVVDDDRGMDMVVVDVICEDVIYGPISAYGDVREKIKAANRKSVVLRVRLPRQRNYMPQIVSCSF